MELLDSAIRMSKVPFPRWPHTCLNRFPSPVEVTIHYGNARHAERSTDSVPDFCIVNSHARRTLKPLCTVHTGRTHEACLLRNRTLPPTTIAPVPHVHAQSHSREHARSIIALLIIDMYVQVCRGRCKTPRSKYSHSEVLDQHPKSKILHSWLRVVYGSVTHRLRAHH